MIGRLMLTGVLALGIASAQRGGGGGGGMGGDDSMGGIGRGQAGGMGSNTGMMMSHRATRAEQMADKLKLNKEQKEEFQTILSAASEKAGTVRTELDKQRAQIAGAMIDGKTGDELNKALADYAAAAAQMTKVEAEAFAKTYALLKPNQQAKADQAFELMAGMFAGGQGGRGGRANGMGRGMGEGMGDGMGRTRGEGR
jgi:hypothetical protein